MPSSSEVLPTRAEVPVDMSIPDQQARNARLDELESRTKEWAAKKRARLQKEVAFGRGLLKGRTGSERLNNTTVSTASELLVEELNQFLSGT